LEEGKEKLSKSQISNSIVNH